MDTLFNLQRDVKASIERAYKNFKKSPKDRLTQVYIETRLESLEALWSEFITTHKQIVAIPTSDLKEKYVTGDYRFITEEIYTDYKAELKGALVKTKPVPKDFHESESNSSCNVKLPKITIPTFAGDYTSWTSFKDLFISVIHNNDSLDNVQKLHYLKGQLSGEAEQLLRHINISGDNYEQCWTLLQNRYDNKKFLANCWLKRLINQKCMSVESANGIKSLLDTTVDSLNALKNLGVDVSSWDILVIYITSSKLDNESRKQWELSTSNSSSELPTFKEFKHFLEGRFRALEHIDETSTRKQTMYSKPKVLHAIDNQGSVPIVSCQFCNSTTHKLINCKLFTNESPESRYNFVQTNRLCFNCLGTHSIKFCRQSTSCQICHRRHHSLIHRQFPKSANDNSVDNTVVTSSEPSSEQGSSPSNEETGVKVTSHFSKEDDCSQVLLATAIVKADTSHGNSQLIRVLLDQGSTSSFISEATVQLLGLKKIPARSDVLGLGGNQNAHSQYMVQLTIHSIHDPTFTIQLKAHVLKTITSLLPSEKISSRNWVEIKDVFLADPEFHTPNKIDVLLGAEVYAQVIREGLIRGPPGIPVAQNTALGWILSGQTNSRCNSINCHHVTVTSHTDENNILKRFWELETEDSDVNKKMLTQEEEQCEQIYAKSTKRDKTGRYIVRLPFRDEDPPCKYGNSRDIAIKRFLMLEKKLEKNSELKRKYSEVIHEYLNLNHMVRVQHSEEPIEAEAVYLPHHAVIREDKTTTKVRIVFDASCKYTNNVSLNDSLMVGPKLQPDLRHIMMKWRCYPICLVADLVKMYRQVKIAEEDTNFQRIVWRDNPQSEIEDYKLLRVTFGTAAAPYLAVKTLQQLASDEGAQYPTASVKTKSDYYVDDLMTGCETVDEGITLHKEMTELMNRGGFQLQKWVTNDEMLANKIMEGKIEEKEVDIKTDETLKILGLTWNRNHDIFKYSIQLPPLQSPVTKRKVISDISRLFDPLGWVAPVIIKAKVFIQELWLSGIEWDEELPDNLLNTWTTYRENLLQISKVQFPRWICTRSTDTCVEIHGFCDASTIAYAAVVYLRVINEEGDINVNLIAARTKVAPVKQVSVPRLELCGAVLLAKLMREVSEVLVIPKSQFHAWTDSTVVLAWLGSHPSRWSTFVGNRVSEILSILDNTQWAHIQTSQNPADIASRGMTPIELSQNKMWKQGPSLLKNQVIDYVKPKSIDTNLEKRTIKTYLATTSGQDDELWTKFSSLQKLIRVIAYCRRFLNLRKTTGGKRKLNIYLTSQELDQALVVCIKHYQRKEFGEDFEELSKTGHVKSKSKLKALSPFIDQTGLLKVGGRIQNSTLSDNVKHPIIIPKKSHLTQLLINDAHMKTLHGGPASMLNYIRSKYWIISVKPLIRFHVRKCVTCVRHAACSRNQLMGQLPSSRVTPTRPFLHSGVDFAGPLNIRVSKGRGNRSYKGYICLFVCMATKAIHLEIISDLTSEGFIAGFKRFVARRGHCSQIWSDNGTNFVGASKELHRMIIAEQSSVALEIRNWLNNYRVTWHFIPPHAPNFGGLWESGVKSTKFHLKRVIGDSTLTYEELSTVAIQIEACLNSRPLSQITENLDDPMPLTPGHFLIGEPLVTVPETNYEQSNVSSLKRWQLTQRMVQNFWRRWSQEYVAYLMQRYKWAFQTPEPKVGDIVLVKEDNLPPARWLLGKIIEKHPGLDTITRVVTIKCNKSVIKRPTSKLCILPTSN